MLQPKKKKKTKRECNFRTDAHIFRRDWRWGWKKKLIQKYIKNIKNIYINYIHIARDRSIWKTKFECRKIKKNWEMKKMGDVL